MLTIVIIIDLFHMTIDLKVKEQVGRTKDEWHKYCLLELDHNPGTSSEVLSKMNSESSFNQWRGGDDC